ncbi:hypothetical protein LCGC14_1203240 [marine sediment metagenome]|uniref:ERCC4 domain-containing protein n=1 Tax=marine sediment metagenome TaxID=412755 RepID=A0A0F9LGA2_9ZZZZ
MEIIMDNRELKTILSLLRIFNEQYNFGFTIKMERLELGDYICRDKKSLVGLIGIERKSADDFVGSVMDGTLFEQVLDMSKVFDLTIVIVIGDIMKIKSKINNNSKWGAVASLITKFGASLFMCPDDEVFAYTILNIFKKCQTSIDLSKIRRPKILKIGRELGAISCAKGIGSGNAKMILKHFRIKDLANIDNPEIISDKIKFIGIKKATNIINLFQGYEDPDFLSDIDVMVFEKYLKLAINNYLNPQSGSNEKQLDNMTKILKEYIDMGVIRGLRDGKNIFN